MIWITVIFLLYVEVYAWYRYKDIICPAVIHNLFWIASMIGAVSFNMESRMSPVAMLIICAGAVIFQIGFSFSLRVTISCKEKRVTCKYRIKHQMFKLLVVIILLMSLPTFYQYYRYLRTSVGSLYKLLKSADDKMSLPAYFSYFRKNVEYLSLAFLAIYWKTDEREKYKIRKYVIALFAISVLCVASVPTRNGLLAYVLPLLVLFVCTHDLSKKTLVLLGSGTFLGFMVAYYAISLGKYWYLYESATDSFAVLIDEIKVYLSGSIVAFGNSFKNHEYMYGGKNTFRFLIAIGDALFGTSNALKLTNEFTVISNLRTNVYTFYDFYLRDFGVGYALLAQFVVSCIHGASYKKMKEGNIFFTYLFSLLSYPLVMQFFQDQYCSLLSTWIQIVLVGILTLKTNIFVIKETEELPNESGSGKNQTLKILTTR